MFLIDAVDKLAYQSQKTHFFLHHSCHLAHSDFCALFAPFRLAKKALNSSSYTRQAALESPLARAGAVKGERF